MDVDKLIKSYEMEIKTINATYYPDDFLSTIYKGKKLAYRKVIEDLKKLKEAK